LSEDQSALVEDVVRTLETESAEVDRCLEEAAEHWPLARLSATDRSVLRAAVAELMGRPGTPARVVLDEAIDIAKRYGSEESGGFVNGVLDRVARRLRPTEF
jgi:N utilization substance protein B